MSQIEGLLDYTDLRLNGSTHNIVLGEDDVPVLREVTIT